MSTEQKDTEQNALASRLSRGWTNFKQGKLVSYRLMAVLILLIAGLGLWWYISAERRKATSARWMDFDEANTPKKLEELAEKNPNTVTARIALLLIARTQLGPEGIDRLGATNPEVRLKAIENIEKARESFGKLLDQFKDDPVFKAECLLGLAKSEMALVAVPAKMDQPTGLGPVAAPTEFRGKVSKVVEYLDQFADAAAPDTPWATNSKKLADALRNEQSATAAEFIKIQRSLFAFAPSFPKGIDPLDPHGGLGPIAPGGTPPVSGIPGSN